ERSTATARDQFLAHGLAAEALASLRQQLARFPGVGTAYLVRKEVHDFPERPFYVLLVAPRGAWFRLRSNQEDHALLKQLVDQLNCPGQTRIVILNSHTRPLGRAVRKVVGAEIYRT